MARIIELILSLEQRGAGTEISPYRDVQQLYTKDGYLVAEYDPVGVRRADNTFEPASMCRGIPPHTFNVF